MRYEESNDHHSTQVITYMGLAGLLLTSIGIGLDSLDNVFNQAHLEYVSILLSLPTYGFRKLLSVTSRYRGNE